MLLQFQICLIFEVTVFKKSSKMSHLNFHAKLWLICQIFEFSRLKYQIPMLIFGAKIQIPGAPKCFKLNLAKIQNRPKKIVKICLRSPSNLTNFLVMPV